MRVGWSNKNRKKYIETKRKRKTKNRWDNVFLQCFVKLRSSRRFLSLPHSIHLCSEQRPLTRLLLLLLLRNACCSFAASDLVVMKMTRWPRWSFVISCFSLTWHFLFFFFSFHFIVCLFAVVLIAVLFIIYIYFFSLGEFCSVLRLLHTFLISY